MTALAHKSAAFELRRGDERALRATSGQLVSLRATEDGWSLLAQNGEVIFRGLGRGARRECLELAHSLGVLAVIS